MKDIQEERERKKEGRKETSIQRKKEKKKQTKRGTIKETLSKLPAEKKKRKLKIKSNPVIKKDRKLVLSRGRRSIQLDLCQHAAHADVYTIVRREGIVSQTSLFASKTFF